MIHHVQLACPAGSEDTLREFYGGLLRPDLDGLAARLTAAGYAVEWSGELPGYRRFYTSEPHGNRLESITLRSSDTHRARN